MLRESTYYSVGGGFVVDEHAVGVDRIVEDDTPLRYPVHHRRPAAGDLPARSNCGSATSCSPTSCPGGPRNELRAELLHIWAVMKECVHNGCTRTEKVLPGGLKVPRRAPKLLADLEATHDESDPDAGDGLGEPLRPGRERGERLRRPDRHRPDQRRRGHRPRRAALSTTGSFPAPNDDGVVRFLLTAAAVGILFKENASISGAEVGCQGEVGSACAMAAGGLCEVLGGTPEQVENAAEIGIEHNLGLTCDPVGGLVQIPCIERNAMASNKAINAARIALRGDGSHKVSLDKAIKTMRETGADMKIKYKETSRGGLAVNVIEC